MTAVNLELPDLVSAVPRCAVSQEFSAVQVNADSSAGAFPLIDSMLTTNA
jgi:hypothetical protein